MKKAGVKVIENDGPEVSYDQAMTSFNILNYEFKMRLEDYLRAHSLVEKGYTVKSILASIGSDDVKQILMSLEQNPTTEAQFFDALFKHRKSLRERVFHYL